MANSVNSPASFVVAFVTRPVSPSVMATCAPDRTLPDGSETWPEIEPVVACDQACKPPANNATGSKLTTSFLITIEHPMLNPHRESSLTSQQAPRSMRRSEGEVQDSRKCL